MTPGATKKSDEAAAAMESFTAALVRQMPMEDQAKFQAFVDRLPQPKADQGKSKCAK